MVEAPFQAEDGTVRERTKGTPQGGVISPLLTNIRCLINGWKGIIRRIHFAVIPNEKFDFLGFTFRPRLTKFREGKCGVNFSPAMSEEAAKAMRHSIRSWRFHRRSDKSLSDLPNMCNPILRGWLNYYGSYYKSALYPICDQLNCALKQRAMRKFKIMQER
jgi:hypothetical protein